MIEASSPHRVTRWLTRASPAMFSIYAVTMAFSTYFAMYSFRKPFAAAHFEGSTFWIFDLKSALILSQLFGYALSKFLGIKFNSELPAKRRAWALIVLIVWAQAALLLFAVVPPPFKVLALFLNGMPLGTVWGVMETFGDVAAAGSANLAAMAPGVSAALITTVTGLLVAIPAMFGYNFLVTSVRGMIVSCDNFAAELSSEIEHRYVTHGSRNG